MKKYDFIKKLESVFTGRKYILIAAISTAVIVFIYSFLIGLITIPLANIAIKRMVPITIFDIIFMFFFSIIGGITIAFYPYAKNSVKEMCTLSSGIFAGFLTSVCPFCPILLLVLLGISITLEFLTPYFPLLRVLSLILLFLTLYLLSKKVKIKRRWKK